MRKKHVRIPNCIKNLYIICRLYKYGISKNNISNIVLLFFEGGYGKHHPGLMDRMKAIIGVYYIAKKKNMQFGLIFSYPFILTKYLVPNKVNWNIEKKDISYKVGDVWFFNYNGKSLNMPKLKVKRQNHCYMYNGYDIILYREHEWEKIWHELYHELFKKSEYLDELMRQCKLPEEYISVHIRFVNMLEKFEDGYNTSISEQKKKSIVEECFNALDEIMIGNNKRLFVFSDSESFIIEAMKKGYNTIMPEKKIGHISYCNNKESYDKAFIDFYAMVGSQKVYSIQGKGLYPSVYSLYASIVGNQNYEIFNLK